ncbi:DUF2382 domain-containing protein [Cellulomonas cellasea]|uniref:Photosystem reaction center subunit H n=2 Tax=Cellulomonas cellasea TaxID=43670 RepID=A0A0A0B350_9CELL|nr:PRC and DUF2382 domain-containing protein [Cellulomonas cellasea]KGM01260.1 photosystem reaction center subunit H [Cellulomonas cellasea DSM 20118]GEA87965.1 photosystem reaction center subunit H [Cellulomonas cellasea]
MITTDQIQTLLVSGGTVVGPDGQKIGKLGQIFLDEQSGQPEWLTVSTGFFGTSQSFVPLSDATVQGDEIHVPFDKDKIKGAPRVDDEDGHLSEAEESELYAYYGRTYGGTDTYESTTTAGLGTTGTDTYEDTDTTYTAADTDLTAGTTGTSTASAGTTDDAMTLSEERLEVGTERVATGRARLRKYIVTEQETVTVPVQREEIRLEREPITEGNVDDALSGPELTESVHEVTLTEERPVVTKETVPVERVRLDTDTVTEQQQVTESTRREEVELETDDDGTTRR